jgi:hypothetical protein
MIGSVADLFYLIWLGPLAQAWNNFAVWFNQF